jgi:hypothetical protein
MIERAEAQKNGGEKVIRFNNPNAQNVRPANVTVTRGSTAKPLTIEGIEKVRPVPPTEE